MALGSVQAASAQELPRYMPPAQTRDEIIAAELSRQKEDQAPALMILFAAGSAQIGPRYRKSIAEFAGYLEDNPGLCAAITGYTDDVGTADANVKLSERRARALKDVLVGKFHVDETRLAVQGRGSAAAAASSGTAAGRKKNRRVEAVIVPRKQEGTDGSD